MLVQDIVFYCEYEFKVCDYVTGEILYECDSACDGYDKLVDTELGNRELAYFFGGENCVCIVAL